MAKSTRVGKRHCLKIMSLMFVIVLRVLRFVLKMNQKQMTII